MWGISKTGAMPVMYQTGTRPVNSTPLQGKYLSRFLKSKREKAFAGADLYSGATHLVSPTLVQAAGIADSDVSSVWWALQRLPFRKEIIAGDLPLVPARPKKPSVPVPMVDDAVILDFVRKVSVPRILDAAVAVEAAE